MKIFSFSTSCDFCVVQLASFVLVIYYHALSFYINKLYLLFSCRFIIVFLLLHSTVTGDGHQNRIFTEFPQLEETGQKISLILHDYAYLGHDNTNVIIVS